MDQKQKQDARLTTDHPAFANRHCSVALEDSLAEELRVDKMGESPNRCLRGARYSARVFLAAALLGGGGDLSGRDNAFHPVDLLPTGGEFLL